MGGRVTPHQYFEYIKNRSKKESPVEVYIKVDNDIKTCNIDKLTVQDTVLVPTEIARNGEREVVYNTNKDLAKWIVKYQRQKAQQKAQRQA